ncbi:hypothetical protein C5167_012698 [Papaver somniferum]|uniref:Uncharacterized protein n=1 Tax=Papaver somniferum TaxID=3469 RepID=A0A4Y7J082_PAPSO|nr:hypothetical protein C5167_012698 [Papaver somniferum]
MQCYSWKRLCRDHDGGIINGPYNGRGTDYLIYGIEKPTLQIPESRLNTSVHIGECSSDSRQADDSLGLSVDMLNLVLQKQITTITSIPPQCRLNLSRDLKSSLDRVLGHPNDLSAWLHLLLLPMHKEVQKGRKQGQKKRKTNVEACRNKISNGLYTAAVRILSSNIVAPDNPDTLHELQQKHPGWGENKNYKYIIVVGDD